ncbi:hypothetical protein B0O80DRAFT_426577 [Mortierella sp. GBAus27b]|nr:hypothetical protein B0O80DRAFT_426577 [Mortierella sp. GBAus27b]
MSSQTAPVEVSRRGLGAAGAELHLHRGILSQHQMAPTNGQKRPQSEQQAHMKHPQTTSIHSGLRQMINRDEPNRTETGGLHDLLVIGLSSVVWGVAIAWSLSSLQSPSTSASGGSCQGLMHGWHTPNVHRSERHQEAVWNHGDSRSHSKQDIRTPGRRLHTRDGSPSLYRVLARSQPRVLSTFHTSHSDGQGWSVA